MDKFLNNHTDKRYYETLWARQLAYQHLTDEDYQTWMHYRSVDKLYLEIGDAIVHWRHIDGDNVIVSRFVLTEVCFSDKGLYYSLVEDGPRPALQEIDHVPQPLGNTEVFAWIPHFNELRHHPENWEQMEYPAKMTVSLSLWQRSNPTKGLRESHDYLTTEHNFKKYWASCGQTVGA